MHPTQGGQSSSHFHAPAVDQTLCWFWLHSLEQLPEAWTILNLSTVCLAPTDKALQCFQFYKSKLPQCIEPLKQDACICILIQCIPKCANSPEVLWVECIQAFDRMMQKPSNFPVIQVSRISGQYCILQWFKIQLVHQYPQAIEEVAWKGPIIPMQSFRFSAFSFVSNQCCSLYLTCKLCESLRTQSVNTWTSVCSFW